MTNNGIYSTAPRGFEPATARKERGMVFSLKSRLFSSVKPFVSHRETFCFMHESRVKLIPSLGDSLPTASSSSCFPSAMAEGKQELLEAVGKLSPREGMSFTLDSCMKQNVSR